MKGLGVIRIVVACTGVPALAWIAAATEPPPAKDTGATAIVFMVKGEASISLDEEPARAIELLQTLSIGTVLRTELESSVQVAFADGRRFEVGETALAVVRTKGIELRKGSIRELPAVPESVRIAPIFDEPAGPAGAGRVRRTNGTDGTFALRPPTGSRLLAGEAELDFRPVQGYDRYQVVVRRGWDDEVFTTEVTAPPVTIPEGVLAPGSTYHWTVVSVDGDRPALREGAVFLTVAADDVASRQALLDIATESEDPALFVLLARIDVGLGLETEACSDVARAAALEDTSEPVKRLARRLHCANGG